MNNALVEMLVVKTSLVNSVRTLTHLIIYLTLNAYKVHLDNREVGSLKSKVIVKKVI
jgi:hypothetical protein